MSDDPANQPPPDPPDVYLFGEAGSTPVFPKVGEPVTYYWSEANRGGEHPDTYHARVCVEGRRPDDRRCRVDCTPLATNGTAYRTTELSAPSAEGIGYSIELWVDVDHHANYSEGYNYAYHAVTVDD